MLSAQLGLEPGGTLGHIYFIPYGNKCTPIIGYKGYLELARRSGQVARLDARVVYEGEKFEVTAGLHPNIEHSVRGDVDRSDDKIVAAYAVAVLKDGAGLGWKSRRRVALTVGEKTLVLACLSTMQHKRPGTWPAQVLSAGTLPFSF